MERRTKAEAYKVVAWRLEEVAPVRGIDFKEDARNDNRLLLQELFEECQATVQLSDMKRWEITGQTCSVDQAASTGRAKCRTWHAGRYGLPGPSS
jgi:hypothetical protein